MPTLYANRHSGNCYKIRLALAQLELPHQLVEVDLHGERPAAVRAASAEARVPVWVLDDGRALVESGAILLYLAQSAEQGERLYPLDPLERAEVHRWMFFEQNLHEPFIATLRYWVALSRRPDERAELLRFWRQRGDGALAAMEAALEQQPFLAAGRYTLADIALYAYTHVSPEAGFELSRYPAIEGWIERVEHQAGWVPMQAVGDPVVAGRVS